MKKMNMADIDRQIIQIQRSTRTTFRPFNPMHNSLRMKYPWYYHWHLWKGANWVHLGLLLLYMVGLGIAVTSFGFLSYKTVNPTKIKAEGENVVKAYNVTGAGVVGVDGYYIGTNGGPYTSAASVEIIKVGSDWKLADDFYKTAAATPEGGGWGEAISPVPTITANGANYVVSDAGYTDCNGEYVPDGFGGYIFNGICHIVSNSGWDLMVDSAIYGGPVVLYHTAAGSPDGGGWSVSLDPSPIPTVTAVDAYIDVSGAGVGDANGTYIIDSTDTWAWGKPGYVKGDWYLSYVTNPQYSINGPNCAPLPGCYINGADTPIGGTWDMYGAPGAAPSSVTISGAGYLVAGAGIVDLNGQYDPVGGGHYSNGGDGDLYQDAGIWYIGGMMTSPPKTYSNSAATPDQGSWAVVNAPAPTVAQGTPPAPTYKISGTILDGSNDPIVGVSVSDGTDTATTDGSGNYELLYETNGDYTITPELQDYYFSPTNRSVTISGADVADIDFTGNLITCLEATGSGIANANGQYNYVSGTPGNQRYDNSTGYSLWPWAGGSGIGAGRRVIGVCCGVPNYVDSGTSSLPGNPWAVITSPPAPTLALCSTGINISGTAKQYDESTNVSNGETVKVAVNGNLQAQTGSTSNGTWTISGVTAPAIGDTITVFIDGVVEDNRANAVTKYDGTGDITGVELYEKHLSIGSIDNQTLSNNDISKYDNSVSSDDDIIFDVDGSNNLTLPAGAVWPGPNQKLYVLADNTWRPASAGGTTSTIPNLVIPNSATVVLDSNALHLMDGGTPLSISGTFNEDTSTVMYVAASSPANITATDYYNLTLSGGTNTAAGNFSVLNVFTLDGAVFNASDKTINLVATDTNTPFVINSGTFHEDTSTFVYTSTVAKTIYVTATTYHDLNLDLANATFMFLGSTTANGTFYNTSSPITILFKADLTYNFNVIDIEGTVGNLIGLGTVPDYSQNGSYLVSGATDPALNGTYYSDPGHTPETPWHSNYYCLTGGAHCFRYNAFYARWELDSYVCVQGQTNPPGSCIGETALIRTLPWIFNPTTVTAVDYVSVSDSNNTGVAFCATHSTDGGGNINWNITAGDTCAGAGITISGTAKQYDESANAPDGETVKVAVNGVLQAQTGTTGSGNWNITGVTAPSSGDIITVFIDGVDDSHEANVVTKYDGTGDITGVELYEKHLSIGSVDNQTLSNANLSQYDYSVSSDEDIFFDVDVSNNLTLPAPGTQTDADQKIYVIGNNIWRPASAGGTTSTVPKVYVPDNATAVLDNNTLKLTGSGQGGSRPLKIGTSGTFDTATSTVYYEGLAATDIAAIGFYNLILNHNGTTFTPYIGFTVSNVFTVNSGNIFNGDDGTIILSGSGTPFVLSGTFQEATSTFKYTGSSATNVVGTTYYNLTFEHSGTTFTAGGSITAKNVLTLTNGTFDTKSGSNYPIVIGTTSHVGSYTQTNGTFNANNSTILSYGDYLVTGGTYNAGGSTLTFDATPGDLDWNTAGYTLNQVRFQSTSVGNTRNIVTAAGTFGIAGSLNETTVANSEPVLIKADTNNTNFNITGGISIYDSAYGINFGNGTWNIHGGFRLPWNSQLSHLNQSTVNFTGSGLIYSDSHTYNWTTNFYNVHFSGNYIIERLVYNNLLTVDSGKTLTSTYLFGACGNATTNNNGTITGAQGQVMIFSGTSPANISTAGVFDIGVRFAQNTSAVVARSYGRSVTFHSHSCGTPATWTLGTAPGQTFRIGNNFNIYNDSGCSSMVIDASTYNPNINIVNNITYSGSAKNTRQLKAGSGTWSVGGNINLTNISLNSGSSLFSLNGNNAQTITSVGNSFNNLRVDSGTSGSVVFADNATVLNTFTDLIGDSAVVFNAGSTFNFNSIDIDGSVGQNIVLRSSVEGSQWKFNVSEDNPTVYSVEVSDSDASGGNKILACENVIDLGNNINWDFCTPPPPPPDSCVLGNIAQVAIKPAEFMIGLGASQLLGIDFKDAQGNPVSKESVSGFKITPDYSNSFWNIVAGGGTLENENLIDFQNNFVAGDTSGQFKSTIAFSACDGVLKASATPSIGLEELCLNIPSCTGNTSLVDKGIDANGCHIWECQANDGGGDGGDDTIITIKKIVDDDPITGSLATVMAGLGLLTLSLTLPLTSSAAISSGAQLLNYLSFLKARAFIFLGIGGKRTRWGVIFDNSTKKPLGFARVALYSWPDNKLRETTVANQVGEFSFLTPPGKYYIVASLSGFKHLKPNSKAQVKGEIRYVPGRTDAYYDNLYYKGEVISILSEEQQKSLIDISLPLEQVSEKKKSFLLSLTTFWYNFVKVVNQIHLPLLIIGTLLAIILLIFRHNIIDWIIIALYVVLWILETYRFLYSGKAPGKVYDTKTNKILDRVLLRIIDSKTADIKGVFVTSRDGQFIFTPPPGVYTISAVREGYKPYFSPAFLVRNLSQLSGFRVKMTPSKEWKK